MLTEMLGKGGNLCSHARSGEIRCPLIVRPNSEDVITGHIFQSLGYLNPRWWLPDMLNEALGTDRFRRQVYRRFKISLWQNQPCYPAGLLPWSEGSTQVDAVITWENSPTTVFVEMKYLSGLSVNVSGDDGASGFPSDQLIRNIRVGLHRCGYFEDSCRLFNQPPRDFVVLYVAPVGDHLLIRRYSDATTLRAAIPHSDRIKRLPKSPFVGGLGYGSIADLLRRQARWLSRSERAVAEQLANYLEFKMATASRGPVGQNTSGRKGATV